MRRNSFNALQSEILAYLAAPGADFGGLAGAVFRFQFEHNRPYRAYCESLGVTPENEPGWDQIPPVPAEAFKSGEPLTCHPVEGCGRLFLTSGTTGEVRGRHYVVDTGLYEASIRHGWVQAGLPDGLRPLFLSRHPSAVPDSSLTFMFEVLSSRAGPDGWLLGEDGSIRPGPFKKACSHGEPVVLFSTALALRHLLDHFPGGCRLPGGSWVFQTGGYKGLAERFDPAILYQGIESQLGVPPERVINEYGMTELSSPSYAIGLGTPHHAPPWLKVRTIHPETNLPNPPGQTGHLVFFDLANLNSVAAVRTRDLGSVLDDHTFVLEGRDPAATPRGCSRASDAFLQNS